MTSTTVISLAIIKLNWDVEGHKDYLENFVPIIAECVRLLNQDVVSIPEIREKLLSEFGLKIPYNSIETILRRVKRKGYIKEEHGVYKPVRKKLSCLNFREIQQKVLRMHETLIEHLKKYCLENHEVTWDTPQTERAIEQYLENYDLLSLMAARDNQGVPPEEGITNRFLVGAFVQHLYTSHSGAIEYLETVVKGNMLANALFLTQPGKVQKKFRRTKLYFDAPLIIYALGYAGEVRKSPCTELLDMLDNSGADLRCWRHTYEEAQGILEACAHRFSSGQLSDAYGPSIEFFLHMGFTATDIFMLSNRLERDIESLGMRIVDKPQYDEHEHVIDEKVFGERLSEGIQYRNQDALNRDIDSVAAVMRSRRGNESYEIEESRALFVTMNMALFRISRNLLRESSEDNTYHVPPCITDKTLTNLLWLKNPFDAPDLPRKRLVADYYAAVQPTERLWQEYISEIQKLKSRGDVTPDDYYLLRHSLEAKTALMDTTLGSVNAFAQGTIPEVLSVVRARIQREFKDELEEKEKEKEQYRIKFLEYESTFNFNRQLQIRNIRLRSRRYAKIITNILQYAILALLVLGMWSTSPWQFPNVSATSTKFFLFSLQLILFILAIANAYWGTTVISYIRKLEHYLMKSIEKIFLDIMGTDQTSSSG